MIYIKKKFRNALSVIVYLMFFTVLLNFMACNKQSEGKLPNKKIHKIVALSPAITSQIIDLDKEDLLAGVTSFHPPLKRKVEIIGTLVKPNIEKIVRLQPDIVLYSNEDCAVQYTERLTSIGINTFEFHRNKNFSAICDNYLTLGKLLDIEMTAKKKIEGYSKELASIKKYKPKSQKPVIAFFVSHKPLITTSRLSYIDNIIVDAGGLNSYSNLKRAYPYISKESLISLNPDIIISMISNPKTYFNKKVVGFQILKAVKTGSVYFIDPDIIALYTPYNYLEAVKQIQKYIVDYHTKNSAK